MRTVITLAIGVIMHNGIFTVENAYQYLSEAQLKKNNYKSRPRFEHK